MPSRPAWDAPQWRQIANATDRDKIRALLEAKGLGHLNVLSRGTHLVLYSEEDGQKVSRARFTRIGERMYELGVADHRGRWETTPFTGTIQELFDLLVDQFGFLLAEF